MKQPQIKHQTVPRETFSDTNQLIEEFRPSLSIFLDQLLWWNERINLVSRDVPRETVWEHICHSLLLSQFPDFQSADLVIDAGTGGGLPGIPLAITNPEKNFILNDIVSKKCLAVKQMVRRLRLDNIQVFDGSIENIQPGSPFLLISKHAFKINELYDLTAPLPWQKMIFYKGIDFENELENIDLEPEVTAFDLSSESGDSFYNEKAIVVVKR